MSKARSAPTARSVGDRVRDVRPESSGQLDEERPARAQVAIVGGGVSGAVAAIQSARAGLKTLVFERQSTVQHKACSEFINREAVERLRECGVDFDALGASSIRRFRLHGPTRTSEGALPFEGRGLSRGKLDEELLRLAADAGAEIRSGVMVRDLLGHGPFRIDTTEGVVEASKLVVATGPIGFRVVDPRKVRDSQMVGCKMHLKLKPSQMKRLKNHLDLFVFEGGYGGLTPIENDLADFFVLLERSVFNKIGLDWNSIAVHVARNCWQASNYLDGAQAQFSEPLWAYEIPHGFFRGGKLEPGIFYIGDQMASVPSMIGDGFSIATLTATEAVASILQATRQAPHRSPHQPRIDHLHSRLYSRQMHRRLRWQVESSYRFHRALRSPRFCDLAAQLINLAPSFLEALFFVAEKRRQLSRAAPWRDLRVLAERTGLRLT